MKLLAKIAIGFIATVVVVALAMGTDPGGHNSAAPAKASEFGAPQKGFVLDINRMVRGVKLETYAKYLGQPLSDNVYAGYRHLIWPGVDTTMGRVKLKLIFLDGALVNGEWTTYDNPNKWVRIFSDEDQSE